MHRVSYGGVEKAFRVEQGFPVFCDKHAVFVNFFRSEIVQVVKHHKVGDSSRRNCPAVVGFVTLGGVQRCGGQHVNRIFPGFHKHSYVVVKVSPFFQIAHLLIVGAKQQPAFRFVGERPRQRVYVAG